MRWGNGCALMIHWQYPTEHLHRFSNHFLFFPAFLRNHIDLRLSDVICWLLGLFLKTTDSALLFFLLLFIYLFVGTSFSRPRGNIHWVWSSCSSSIPSCCLKLPVTTDVSFLLNRVLRDSSSPLLSSSPKQTFPLSKPKQKYLPAGFQMSLPLKKCYYW